MAITCPGSKKKQAIISRHFLPNILGDPIKDRLDIIGVWIHFVRISLMYRQLKFDKRLTLKWSDVKERENTTYI
jgi:hypothetical protein